MYAYLKTAHIIFIVTWFAGLFYITRLFIYSLEAEAKEEVEKTILQKQFGIMSKRLWLGITWPSAIITLILGPWLMFQGNWQSQLGEEGGKWLLVKIVFVVLLYFYHFSLHKIYSEQQKGIFKYTSQRLRGWNEVATIFLVTIVSLATVKTVGSFAWSFGALVLLIVVLLLAIRLYKIIRK